jgi:hypothetical protein
MTWIWNAMIICICELIFFLALEQLSYKSQSEHSGLSLLDLRSKLTFRLMSQLYQQPLADVLNRLKMVNTNFLHHQKIPVVSILCRL